MKVDPQFLLPKPVPVLKNDDVTANKYLIKRKFNTKRSSDRTSLKGHSYSKSFSSMEERKSSSWWPPFGDSQLLCFVLSALGLTIYFCHFALAQLNRYFIFTSSEFASATRIRIHLYLEVYLLIARHINELKFGKIEFQDWMHHISMYLGFYLVLNNPACIPFDWLVCHMQVLHIPMMFWYLGCRKNSYIETTTLVSADIRKVVKQRCDDIFRFTIFPSSGFRFIIMFLSAYKAVATKDYWVAAIAFTINCLMIFLDWNWTIYFLDNIGWPTKLKCLGLFLVGLSLGVFNLMFLP